MENGDDPLAHIKRALGDRYRVDHELGRGGMAIVYLAEDLKHSRRVAIKVLKPNLIPALGPERFLREIATAARLAHPNILPLHDSGEADGLLYYVTPYLEGETLRDRLQRERQLPLNDALQIAREVADALGYAHSLGIVHRDIKPENILFQAGHAVVTDFGIARAITEAGGPRLTESGLVVGTPAYLSPEQATGAGLDGRSDIYSLGCVLYEMLVGEPPSLDALPASLSIPQPGGPLPGLRVARETVPAVLEGALARALARLPADRFATASQFAEALERSRVGEPVPAPGRRPRARTVALLALLAATAGVGLWWAAKTISGAGGRRIESLAVLPLANISADPDQEYFVAGMHDALIGELSRFSALRVVSRTSTLGYKDSRKSLAEIARELNVDAVVEGSVLRAGDSVRIRVELIRARPREQPLWTQAYDRHLRNVLALYGDVARAIASEIKLKLTPREEGQLAAARPVNPQAYDAYLRGRVHWRRFTRADLDTALQYFEAALQTDPGLSTARSGIAHVWSARMQMGFVAPREAGPKAEEAALRALALDSAAAENWFATAVVRGWYRWNWMGADSAFRRSLELDPNNPDTRALYAHLLNILRRPDEAREQMDRALALDPFNPLYRALHGVLLSQWRRYDDAINESKYALQLSPTLPIALNGLVRCLEFSGRYDEALAEVRRQATLAGDRERLAALTEGYAQGGYRGAMRRVAELMVARSRSTYVRAFEVANLFVRAGDTKRALDWLDSAAAQRDPNLPYLAVGPAWDSLRDDPRFHSLLRRLNLAP